MSWIYNKYQLPTEIGEYWITYYDLNLGVYRTIKALYSHIYSIPRTVGPNGVMNDMIDGDIIPANKFYISYTDPHSFITYRNLIRSVLAWQPHYDPTPLPATPN